MGHQVMAVETGRGLPERIESFGPDVVVLDIKMVDTSGLDVLQEVRSRVSFVGSDVVKLYEQWKRTRSEWIERRMRALGLIVPDGEAVH